MKKKFDFDNITLIPSYSYVNSRSECDTTLKFGHLYFKLPIVPSNMESIIDSNLAIDLAKNGYFYIMHRFNVNPIEFTTQMHDLGLYSSVSIGVNEDSYEYIDQFVELVLCPEYITIDIAHGHCVKMKKMVKYIKEHLPNTFLTQISNFPNAANNEVNSLVLFDISLIFNYEGNDIKNKINQLFSYMNPEKGLAIIFAPESINSNIISELLLTLDKKIELSIAGFNNDISNTYIDNSILCFKW